MKWLKDMINDIIWYFGWRRDRSADVKDAVVENVAYAKKRRRKHWRDKWT